jgi:hypothetical protein
MIKKSVLILLFVCITSIMAGCRLAVIATEGGDVGSQGSGTCFEGMICITEVPNTNFWDNFEAVPNEGWYFHKWNSGDRFFCGDDTLPMCELSFDPLEGNQSVRDLVASSELFYLMPVFKEYPRSVLVEGIPRVIVADGKKHLWLQPSDFVGYSYNEISRACPKGVCSGNLPTSTIDLTGYVWASRQDIGLLFQAHEASNRSILADFDATDLLYFDVKLPTIKAVLSDPPKVTPEYSEAWTYQALVIGDENNQIATDEVRAVVPGDDPDYASSKTGAWFWRAID